jgi:hypothetical protein
MFFPERIRSIRPGDRVLEVGPGGTPHPRADVFLEKAFSSEQAAKGQRGHAPPLVTEKPVISYEGGRFPFSNDEFDYVICSHVLEHVDDVDALAHELSRVAHRGYLEFPTVYYDYLYDFPEHPTIVFHDGDAIYWMPKSETCLPAFRPVTAFFYQSLVGGQTSLVDALKNWIFQGFEWHEAIRTQRTHSLYDVCYPLQRLDPSQLGSASRRRWMSWLHRKRRAA